MANPMFGWSAQDVFALVQACNSFLEAYRCGPGSASSLLRNFKRQVQSCHDLLSSIHEALQQQDREFFYNKFQPDSLKDTLEQCATVFIKSELSKPEEEQRTLQKFAATASWLFCDEKKVEKLSKVLAGHITYIQAFLQVIQSRNTKDQKEILLEIRDHLRVLRTQSLVSIPISISPATVIDEEKYIQTQKELVDVQGRLQQVNSQIVQSRTEGERLGLLNVQAELEAVKKRILESIKRNEVKGVQNALTLTESVSNQQYDPTPKNPRDYRQESRDSGYAASISSYDASYNPQYSRMPNSPTGPRHDSHSASFYEPDSSIGFAQPRSPTTLRSYSYSSGSSKFSEVVQAAATARANSEYYEEEICQAEIFFSDGRKKVARRCSIWGRYEEGWLCQIFPKYADDLAGNCIAPALVFDKNKPRPIPHIAALGPSSKTNIHPVQLKRATIIPSMTSLEYIFATAQASRNFQEKVFNKVLVLKEATGPINVGKIRSGRGKESDCVALRIWKPRNIIATKGDCSVLYFADDRTVKEHIEIRSRDIESLTEEKNNRLKVHFKPKTSPWKNLRGWLQFEFDENADGRTTLANYLNPKRFTDSA